MVGYTNKYHGDISFPLSLNREKAKNYSKQQFDVNNSIHVAK